jgi:hypothetical protein
MTRNEALATIKIGRTHRKVCRSRRVQSRELGRVSRADGVVLRGRGRGRSGHRLHLVKSELGANETPRLERCADARGRTQMRACLASASSAALFDAGVMEPRPKGPPACTHTKGRCERKGSGCDESSRAMSHDAPQKRRSPLSRALSGSSCVRAAFARFASASAASVCHVSSASARSATARDTAGASDRCPCSGASCAASCPAAARPRRQARTAAAPAARASAAARRCAAPRAAKRPRRAPSASSNLDRRTNARPASPSASQAAAARPTRRSARAEASTSCFSSAAARAFAARNASSLSRTPPGGGAPGAAARCTEVESSRSARTRSAPPLGRRGGGDANAEDAEAPPGELPPKSTPLPSGASCTQKRMGTITVRRMHAGACMHGRVRHASTQVCPCARTAVHAASPSSSPCAVRKVTSAGATRSAGCAASLGAGKRQRRASDAQCVRADVCV